MRAPPTRRELCSSLALAILPPGGAGFSQDRQRPAPIADRVEMFVDRWLIESMRGAKLRLAAPERREIVLETNRPWEGPASAYFTVLRDGLKIRLYYRGYCPTDASELQVTCLAESADGIHFERPDLGLFEFGGSKKNNIVWQGVEAHNFAPFLDLRQGVAPEERYKALAGISSKLFAFASPDGVRWHKLQQAPVMTDGAFDSLNLAFWDSSIGAYRCYNRYWSGDNYRGFRAIQSATSPDFRRWTKMLPNVYGPNDPNEHFYTNATLRCPGAEHHYLSFPKRFVPERTKRQGYAEPGVSDAVFLSSRDGVHWDRTFREAWVRPGRDEKNWTQRSNMPAWGIVETAADEFSMYISERYDWPDHRIRRLAVRKHGFASVHAGAAGGEALTRPVIFTGTRLAMNVATSAAGSVRVELQDEANKPLPGFTLEQSEPYFGDEIEAVARWKSGADLNRLSGRPVRARFVLQDADLYSIRFANG